MNNDSITRVQAYSWIGLIMAVLSAFVTQSVLLQIVLLGLGAAMFIMATFRIIIMGASSTLASKKTLVALSSVAAGSFFTRFAILLATAQPARYGSMPLVRRTNWFK
jgi:hypothetical protein